MRKECVDDEGNDERKYGHAVATKTGLDSTRQHYYAVCRIQNINSQVGNKIEVIK